jgi:hypothetical protein
VSRYILAHDVGTSGNKATLYGDEGTRRRDGVWYAGSAEGAALVERASVANLKRTWILSRPPRD